MAETSAAAAAAPAPAPAETAAPAAAPAAPEAKAAPAAAPEEKPESILRAAQTDPATDGKQGQPSDVAKAKDVAAGGELTLKLPDGVEVDPADLAEYTKVAKDAGLDSEKASKLVEWHLGRQEAASKRAVSDWADQGKKWLDELAADPAFGGKNLSKSVADYQRGLTKFGGKELEQELERLGIINHPLIAKAFAAAGAAIGEDVASVKQASGKAAAQGRDDRLKNLYPTLVKPDGSIT